MVANSVKRRVPFGSTLALEFASPSSVINSSVLFTNPPDGISEILTQGMVPFQYSFLCLLGVPPETMVDTSPNTVHCHPLGMSKGWLVRNDSLHSCVLEPGLEQRRSM